MAKEQLREEEGLTHEQAKIVRAVANKQSVFFTGAAGTGKTHTLTRCINVLKHLYKRDEIAVTAATGIAATHVGGTTVHSALGVGLPLRRRDFRKNMGKKHKQLRRLSAIVIDEISMVSAEQLELIDKAMQEIIPSPKPFGGKQLVLSGDFVQLPPVRKAISGREDEFTNDGLAFESKVWEELNLQQALLRHSFRHNGSSRLETLLNQMREGGKAAVKAVEMIKKESTGKASEYDDGIKPTELHARNLQVDERNERELQKLPSAEVDFTSVDSVRPEGKTENERAENRKSLESSTFWNECLARKVLTLKKGAQVMVIKNIDLQASASNMIVNGSRGVVTGFTTPESLISGASNKEGPNNNNDVKVTGETAPAGKKFTRYKEEKEDDVQLLYGSSQSGESKALEQTEYVSGRLPVASKMKAKTEVNEETSAQAQHEPDFEQNPPAVVDGSTMSHLTKGKEWNGTPLPIVKFSTTGRTTTVGPELFHAETQHGVCERMQVPLKLAWALSMHKSQGMTLTAASLDLSYAFTYGQAYVALSRVQSLASLHVKGTPRKEAIEVHPAVVQYYRCLQSGVAYPNRKYFTSSCSSGKAINKAEDQQLKQNTSTSERDYCFRCGAKGHWASNCKSSQSKRKRSKS